MAKAVVIAYATTSYKHVVDIWSKSLMFESDLLLDESKNTYLECIEKKMNMILNYTPRSELVIVSDVDIVFFKSRYWNELFEKIQKSSCDIFFMRDAVKENLNAGFFIVKKDYFETTFKDFLRHMLDDGSFRNMKHYEQSYMNEHLKNWEFIPDEYVYIPNTLGTNMAKVLFYHSICTTDKIRSMNLSQTTKDYQVHVCFHDDDNSVLSTQNVLYKYPWMIPFKLSSTKYFESEFFDRIEIDEHAKYIGMITYSILWKPRIFKMNLKNILENSHADVIAFNHLPNDTLRKTDKDHPIFTRIWCRLIKKLFPDFEGDPLDDSVKMFYNNYWVAKPNLFRRYQEVLKKAMVFLEEDPKVYEDAHYKSGKLSSTQLEKINGKGYYTYHPFVIERLPCFFFWYINAEVSLEA